MTWRPRLATLEDELLGALHKFSDPNRDNVLVVVVGRDLADSDPANMIGRVIGELQKGNAYVSDKRTHEFQG